MTCYLFPTSMLLAILLAFSLPLVSLELQAQTSNRLHELIEQERYKRGLSPYMTDTTGEQSIRNHMEWASIFLRNKTIHEIPEIEVFHQDPTHPANRQLSGYSATHRYFTVLDPHLRQYLKSDSTPALGSFENHLPFLEQHNNFLTPYGFTGMEGKVLDYSLEKEGALIWEFYGKGDEQAFLDALLANSSFLMQLEGQYEEDVYKTRIACHSREINGEKYHIILFSLGF